MRKMKVFYSLVLVFLIGNNLLAQYNMTSGKNYLLKDGKPTFINGANFSPSKGLILLFM